MFKTEICLYANTNNLFYFYFHISSHKQQIVGNYDILKIDR